MVVTMVMAMKSAEEKSQSVADADAGVGASVRHVSSMSRSTSGPSWSAKPKKKNQKTSITERIIVHIEHESIIESTKMCPSRTSVRSSMDNAVSQVLLLVEQS